MRIWQGHLKSGVFMLLLFNFAEQKAEEQGYKEIVLWAFKNNHHAVSFYQKRGYSIDKEEYRIEPDT